MKKLLNLIFLYQIIMINSAFTAEIETKTKVETLSLNEFKKMVPKKQFDNYTKEELKFILLTLRELTLEKFGNKNFTEASCQEEKELIEELYNAVRNNDYEKVQAILAKTQVDPHMIFHGIGTTPFYEAACYNRLNIVKLFIWHSGYNLIQLKQFHSIFFNNTSGISKDYKPLYDFMQNYAPKIARIKSENMIAKINEFLSYQVNNIQELPTVLTEMIDIYSLYPQKLSDLVKFTNEEIDQIIELYDNEFNVGNGHYLTTMAEIEEEFSNIKFESREKAKDIDIEKASNCCTII